MPHSPQPPTDAAEAADVDPAFLADAVYRRTLGRARAFSVVILVVQGLLFYLYDYASYAAGRWDESVFYQYGVVWRAASVALFALHLGLDAALRRRHGDRITRARRVLATLYPALVLALGTSQAVLNQMIVADVSIYALCILTVATLLHLPNRATWAYYPLSLVALVAGVRALNPDPAVWMGLATNAAALVVIAFILERLSYHSRIRNLTYARALEGKNVELETALDELKATHDELRTAQDQLVHQEKLASLGALTAGIAHELKNPLNFVNNFAELNADLADELAAELAAHPERPTAETAATVAPLVADLRGNAAKIRDHGRRADGIIRSMMQHARKATGRRDPVDLNAFVEEYATLAHHSFRAQSPACDVSFVRDYDPAVGTVPVLRQELGQVLVNLFTNAVDAVTERAAAAPPSYAPAVTVRTRRLGDGVEICVSDNGAGIPEAVRARVFEPFFTTKPVGRGTGLGLSIAYDIVTQSHGGRIEVESREGEGTTFTIVLPAREGDGEVTRPVTGGS